ncbi:MAG: peroxidase family protein [Myxococcota bacterium]
MPSGFVFFGQFVDHDVTFDTTSSLTGTGINTPGEVENFRTPCLDLDCVYGRNPEASPHLYFQGTVEEEGIFAGATVLWDLVKDLERNSQDTALIGDPRNDENAVVSQLQLSFIRFHNAVVAEVHRRERLEGPELFMRAKEIVLRHYHWIVVHDFLPRVIGRRRRNRIQLRGRVLYRPEDRKGGRPFVPVEFSVAAYRFGHTQVPGTIDFDQEHLGLGLFDPELGGAFGPRPGLIDWTRFFGSAAKKARALDTQLASTLLELPFIAEGDRSLAVRNLLRGQAFGLPSGQTLREVLQQRLGRSVPLPNDILTDAEKTELQKAGYDPIDFIEDTPLWFYVLAEGESLRRGRRLGPVGGHLVGETLLGLMELDPRSYLFSAPDWSPGSPQDDFPLLPGRPSGRFRMVDLLRIATESNIEDDNDLGEDDDED